MTETQGYLAILHFVGMVFWLGFLPYRNLLLCVARDTDSVVQRRRALEWERKLWRNLFLPGVALVASTGLGLASMSGAGGSQWLTWKLAAVVGALGLEVSFTWNARREAERLLVGSDANNSDRVQTVNALLGRAIAGSCLGLILLVGAILVSFVRAVPILPLALVSVATLGVITLHLAAVRRLPADTGRFIPDA